MQQPSDSPLMDLRSPRIAQRGTEERLADLRISDHPMADTFQAFIDKETTTLPIYNPPSHKKELFLVKKALRNYRIKPDGIGVRERRILVVTEYFSKKLLKKYSAQFGTENKGKFEKFLKDKYQDDTVPICCLDDLQENVKEKIVGLFSDYTIVKHEGKDCIHVIVK